MERFGDLEVYEESWINGRPKLAGFGTVQARTRIQGTSSKVNWSELCDRLTAELCQRARLKSRGTNALVARTLKVYLREDGIEVVAEAAAVKLGGATK